MIHTMEHISLQLKFSSQIGVKTGTKHVLSLPVRNLLMCHKEIVFGLI
jgi:hypothetical protein